MIGIQTRNYQYATNSELMCSILDQDLYVLVLFDHCRTEEVYLGGRPLPRIDEPLPHNYELVPRLRYERAKTPERVESQRTAKPYPPQHPIGNERLLHPEFVEDSVKCAIWKMLQSKCRTPTDP